jgi:hypothetical protein
VEALCQSGVLLHKGQVSFKGSVHDTIPKYLASFERAEQQDLDQETDRSGSGKVRLRRVRFYSDGALAAETMSGADVIFEFTYTNRTQVKSAQLLFTIYTEGGVPIAHINTALTGFVPKLEAASGNIRCTVKRLGLNQGRYRVAVAVQEEGGETYDQVSSALWFTVVGSRYYAAGRVPDPRYSPTLVEHLWTQ